MMHNKSKILHSVLCKCFLRFTNRFIRIAEVKWKHNAVRFRLHQ